jgi:energy-coupling factor transporter ATP-binding protein EcfA2
MIKLVIGKEGSGKTTKLVKLSNELAQKSPGNVVLIVNTDKRNYDLNLKVRLINIESYNISKFCELYGFICGICAGNYDVTDILIDSVFALENLQDEKLNKFIKKLSSIQENSNVSLTLALSKDETELSEEILSLAEIKC